MQTFLPYASFDESARCLDRMRLGKQRVECKQLLLALGIPVGDHSPNPTWSRHPACKMWRHFPLALAEYGMVVCQEWRSRGYSDSLLTQFESAWQRIAWSDGNVALPPWIGSEPFHASHRSNLLRKNPAHYGQFGWAEQPGLEYVWPV